MLQTNVESGYTEKATVEEAKRELEARYRLELNRKLDEVNAYLEEQARTRQKLDLSRDEQDAKIRHDKKRLEVCGEMIPQNSLEIEETFC